VIEAALYHAAVDPLAEFSHLIPFPAAPPLLHFLLAPANVSKGLRKIIPTKRRIFLELLWLLIQL
jgi:hypothetical protein